MAITPVCDMCGSELHDYGAILLSPPKKGKVDKYHICKQCYQTLAKKLQNASYGK